MKKREKKIIHTLTVRSVCWKHGLYQTNMVCSIWRATIVGQRISGALHYLILILLSHTFYLFIK